MADAVQDRADMLHALLPPGPAWTGGARGDETQPKLLRAVAGELVRITSDLDMIVDGFFPDTATADFLPDWERVLSLPHDGGEDVRRLRILAKLRGYGDPSVPNMQAIVDTFVTGGQIATRPYVQFRVSISAVGAALRDDVWLSTFIVTYPGPVNSALEAAIIAAKPLHTRVEFIHA